MTLAVVFHRLAEQDLIEAIDWYETQSVGLGRRFMDEVRRSIGFIQEFPEAAPVARTLYRCKVLRDFPYSIFYRLFPEQIRILAIAHHRRRPQYWRQRN